MIAQAKSQSADAGAKRSQEQVVAAFGADGLLLATICGVFTPGDLDAGAPPFGIAAPRR